MQNEKNLKSDRAKREEITQKFWQDNKIFEETLKDESKPSFVFYDGPPFGTGLPHYGHILAGTIKDVIPRYQTMQGKFVPRTWGWDCHGLPVENLIEKKLNLNTKQDIEAYGISLFNTEAQNSVLEYRDEWKQIVPRLGRFVDMENDYKTMDATYTESIWWGFSELYKKGLIYEGYKIMHLCPRCETTLSNFEVTQGYKDITDISVYVKFELKDTPQTYLVAWTTTPWTLPGNVALALNQDALYVTLEIEGDAGAKYVIGKDVVEKVLAGKNYTILKEEKGLNFVGQSYTPPFDYYLNTELKNKENAWKIYHADFVTTDTGTGIAHEAPAFGAEDKELADKVGLPLIKHVGTDGRFKKEVTHFAGSFVKPKDNHQVTDIEIIKWLAHNHKLFSKEKIIHSYPHCWRCDTPLLNYASSSWFVRVTEIKDKLIKANQEVKWIPEHIRDGRFGKWLEGAHDWAISRSRFWGAPLPVWKGQDNEIVVIKSINELKKYTKKSGNKYFMIRHGESESNIKKIVSYQHGNTTPLTENGIEQVKKSAESLKDKGITKIIASPFLRTTQTAQIIKDIIGLTDDNLIFDERLIDINAGIFEGKLWEEYFDFFKDDYGIVKQKTRFTIPPIGGETLTEVKKRVGNCLYEIEKNYQNENILFVGHGASLWMLEAVSRGADTDETINIRYGNNKHDNLQDYVGNAVVREIDFVPLPHNANYELDLHRPYIDEIELVDNGANLTRIKEVFDCWFESGSMPFASMHYMGDNKSKEGVLFNSRFPADFIAEGLDQTRGWFYSLMVLSVALFDKAPFKQVVVNGMILAEDGQKMSKRLQNYPELLPLVDNYGADALRYYLMNSPTVRGEELRLSEKDVSLVASKVLGRLENVLSFYEIYRDKSLEKDIDDFIPKSFLNKWIVDRLDGVIVEATNNMNNFELDKAIRPFDLFIDDLSTWYLRRSRENLKEGNIESKKTLYFVLKNLSKVIAPFMPFLAENIFQVLRNDKDVLSVHLDHWPKFENDFDEQDMSKMSIVRSIITLGLEARQKNNIKVRQPLQKIAIINCLELEKEYIEMIQEELNIKQVEFSQNFDKDLAIEVNLDITITDELKLEGDMRELMRGLQDFRKELNLVPDQIVTLIIQTDEYGTDLVEKFKIELTKKVGLKEILFDKCECKVIEINSTTFKAGIIV